MPKVFHYSKCQEEQSRPVGKKCLKSAGESFSSAAQVPAQLTKSLLLTRFCYNCTKLGKMEAIDRRVQHTEAALVQGISRVSLLHTTSQSQSQYDTVLHGIDTELASSQSVVPSVSYLRNNESVQNEVEKHFGRIKKS